MHWVDRGAEPIDLDKIRTVHTSRWVEHYTEGVGVRPTDARWRRFHHDLALAFEGICGYCEEYTKGEVDHFRPKSRFPNLVYCWTNWVFSCHACNQAKGTTWPDGGYVDPCAKCRLDRPERHFVFDIQTGFILPSRDLNPNHRQRAWRTIVELGLNDLHHLRKRVQWLELFSASVSVNPDVSNARTRERIMRFASPKAQFSSLIQTWLAKNGYPPPHFGGAQTSQRADSA